MKAVKSNGLRPTALHEKVSHLFSCVAISIVLVNSLLFSSPILADELPSDLVAGVLPLLWDFVSLSSVLPFAGVVGLASVLDSVLDLSPSDKDGKAKTFAKRLTRKISVIKERSS